ncbi:hypothetical protein BRADI_2g41872v3 [Brachypodium distachyon]|uniref:Uncharacterized protein n=1 Tax=Brachypodium distachyon TaxID=15368 RepID=A0A0Q3MVT3_BRADI|nr:hypothetical protein BRADI_2g41872v3 [Brachypodium distachyon]
MSMSFTSSSIATLPLKQSSNKRLSLSSFLHHSATDTTSTCPISHTSSSLLHFSLSPVRLSSICSNSSSHQTSFCQLPFALFGNPQTALQQPHTEIAHHLHNY